MGELRDQDRRDLPKSGQPVIDEELLKILACPLEETRPPLELQGGYLVCKSCGYGFEIRDGIPDLLPEDALSPERLRELLK